MQLDLDELDELDSITHASLLHKVEWAVIEDFQMNQNIFIGSHCME